MAKAENNRAQDDTPRKCILIVMCFAMKGSCSLPPDRARAWLHHSTYRACAVLTAVAHQAPIGRSGKQTQKRHIFTSSATNGMYLDISTSDSRKDWSLLWLGVLRFSVTYFLWALVP